MAPEVLVAAGSLRLGLLTVLLFVIRWPDLQITSLFARGFRVAGMVEPSNVYPRVATGPAGSIEEIMDPETQKNGTNAWRWMSGPAS